MLGLFLRDSLIYGLTSILSRSLGFLLLPIYTRILEPQDYGVLDLITTAVVFINLVLALEIGQGFARYWHEMPDQEHQVTLASTAWWFSVILGLLFCFFSNYYSMQLNKAIFKHEEYLPVFQVACIFLFLNCLFYTLLNQLRWDMQSRQYAVISFINAILVFSLGISFSYYRDMALLGIVEGQAVAALVSIIFSLFLLRKSIKFCFSFSKLTLMLRFSLPLVPASIAAFLTLYVNRLALNTYGTLDEIGIYGAASRLASIVAVFAFGVQTALTPLIYKNYKKVETSREVASIFHVFLGFSLLLTLAMSTYAPEILMIMVGANFYEAVNLIPYLTLGLLFSQLYSFFPGIAIHKKTHWQLLISLLTAVTSIVLNYLLVPSYGMLGAAISVLVSYLVFLISWAGVSQKLYPIDIKLKAIGLSLAAYVAVIMILFKLPSLEIPYFSLFFIKSLLLLIFFISLFSFKMIPKFRFDDAKELFKKKTA